MMLLILGCIALAMIVRVLTVEPAPAPTTWLDDTDDTDDTELPMGNNW